MSADVLIVVPCLNEAAALPGLLRQQLTENPDRMIVVADGGSTDGSRELVERLAESHAQLVLLDNPARLQSAGVNLAMRRHGAGVRWLVRMDAHCDYPPGYVDGLLAAAAARDATSVVVPMISRGIGCFQIAAATAQNSRLGTGGSAHRHVGEGQWIDHGHHALMDAALFGRVGGYREDWSHNEDAELDLRLLAVGGRIWLEPSLALHYHPRATPGALTRQYWRYGQGRARTLLHHARRPKLRQLLPLLPPLAALMAVAAPWWPPLALPLVAWAALCLGSGMVVGARAGGRCAMASGVAAALMQLAWGAGFVRQLLRRRA